MEAIRIDASYGSGGGQILRNSLALSSLLRKPVRIYNIRAKRPKPGLRRQHLTAVKLAKTITNAKVNGMFLNSRTLYFEPRRIEDCSIAANIGSAGSVFLALQSVMLPALFANLQIKLFGGTDVPFATPSAFFSDVFLREVNSIGARFEFELVKRGYYPKGNGLVKFNSKKINRKLKPIEVLERGSLQYIKCVAHCASLPKEIADTLARTAKNYLLRKIDTDWHQEVVVDPNKETSGMGLDLIAFFEHSVLAVNVLGRKGNNAEQLAIKAAKQLIAKLNSEIVYDEHLADQILYFLVLANGTSRIQTRITKHILSNIWLIKKFITEAEIEINKIDGEFGIIEIKGISFKQS
ncbi:MAG: RNA 3'-phosphate cyclase [Candidatus Diapherotrites archaeon]|nr:RNA 3'-phosphate cyclase [Candidatus Diapherotrites archaeon]